MSLENSLAVSRLIAVLGRVEGRKRLQKIVHLIKARGYPEFDQDFVLHYYGPFSRQLASQIDFLCQTGFVQETRTHPNDAFVYEPAAAEDASSPKTHDPSAGDQSEPEWAPVAKALDQKETAFLEALSTIVYLHNTPKNGTPLENEFCRIKPNLSQRFAEVSRYAAANNWL